MCFIVDWPCVDSGCSVSESCIFYDIAYSQQSHLVSLTRMCMEAGGGKVGVGGAPPPVLTVHRERCSE